MHRSQHFCRVDVPLLTDLPSSLSFSGRLLETQRKFTAFFYKEPERVFNAFCLRRLGFHREKSPQVRLLLTLRTHPSLEGPAATKRPLMAKFQNACEKEGVRELGRHILRSPHEPRLKRNGQKNELREGDLRNLCRTYVGVITDRFPTETTKPRRPRKAGKGAGPLRSLVPTTGTGGFA